MADDRYSKLLGIEPAGEIPTHYELLGVSREEHDDGVIEASYKEKMRALQSIRSSKDKGFIEFLKEELRTARLTLTKADRRKAYDESLEADSVQGFKDWVKPLLAMGFVPKSVYDLMLQTGVKEGLKRDQAAKLVKELAQEHGATLQLEESSSDLAALENSGYDDADDDEGAGAPEVDDSEPMFLDDIDPETPATEPARAPTQAPGTRRPPPPRPAGGANGGRGKIQRGFYTDGAGERSGARGGASSSPSAWDRGGSGGSGAGTRGRSAWGRRRGAGASASTTPAQSGGRRRESTARQRERWQNQGDQRELSEAQRAFNMGARLCGVAEKVHTELGLYFPPKNGRNSITYQRNGVSYDKVFETEHKTYRDALKRFSAARERAESLGPLGEELKRLAEGNLGLVKSILDEIRQLKLKRLAGMTKGEELRLWQGFVNSRRPGRLTKTVSLA